jgi:spermidine synthase
MTATRPFALPLRPLFTATILLGSFLLFLIQPMFGRQVLPVLGGSPSVWNTAMLFYQAALLLGYLYAHAVRRLALGAQVALHLALFAVAALTLPIGLAAWMPAQGATHPALWLLGLLAASIGPVFFVVSAQAPLMQAWFARSGHRDAANPFFLYAASNAGSFAALIAYPLLVEPNLRLGAQTWLWSGGFVLLAAMVALCGVAVRGAPAAAEPARVAVTWRQRGRWALLAAVPSGLLLSTTTHLTTDIMAMPLLWVIPLAVYLLSFILAFGARGAAITRGALAVAPLALLFLGGAVFISIGALATLFAAAGIILLFIVALALHGTLAVEKPAAGALTDFYLWISVGGALGGVFGALIAPLVFDWPYEHPLLLVAAAMLIPAAAWSLRLAPLWDRAAVRIGVAVLALPLSWFGGASVAGRVGGTAAATAVLLGIATLLATARPRLFGWLFGMTILALGGWSQIRTSHEGRRERSFFGVYTVQDSAFQNVRRLLHGTTLHGIQSRDPALATVPMTYYAPMSGVGLAFAAAPRLYGDSARIGVVGLGTGTLACYAKPGQAWTIFEIDPVVVGIARREFSYLAKCLPDARIVIGDARLTLAAERAGALDLLAVDAFSSDAVPLHLVTREALRVYGRALAPDGILLMHVSNRFLRLQPVVAAIARAEGWTAVVRDDRPAATQLRGEYFTRSSWIALARDPARLAAMRAATGADRWRPLRTVDGITAWSDDFASVLPVLKRPG